MGLCGNGDEENIEGIEASTYLLLFLLLKRSLKRLSSPISIWP
jgi:hypothetical protein